LVGSIGPIRAQIEAEIALLREYRTRLIADVVTGKLDVREAAAGLPDEPEEPKPLDEPDDQLDPEDASSDELDAVLEEAEA
jgi:type I restriction enzyme S subunit